MGIYSIKTCSAAKLTLARTIPANLVFKTFSMVLAQPAQDAKITLRMIPSARAINDAMPAHMLELLRDALNDSGQTISGARLLILGYAYLENSDDTRNSPSDSLINLLKLEQAAVDIHDPYVTGLKGDIYEMAKDRDALVVMVRHNDYLGIDLPRIRSLMSSPILIDGRNVFNPERVHEAGFIYRGVGRAKVSAP